ncbi:MAG: hypothetical protein KGK30_09890, partial [Elusimicrobia bacterium]|nr:hypothetical protein [Elusimicrobiota bacterium]
LSGRSPLQKLSLLFRGALPSQSVGMTPRYWAARAKRVASRVPTLLSSARHPAARENAEALARLERWLST